MGLSVKNDHFTAADYHQFSARVRENLAALRQLLNQPDFGVGPSSFGAELEMYIIDSDNHVAPINDYLIQQCADKQLQPELNRFNLEYNLSVVQAKGSPFLSIEREIEKALSTLNHFAAEKDCRVIPIGILPTLRESDISSAMISDLPRYHALSKGLRKMRDGPFQIDIDGKPPLSFTTHDVALEGANTSFQFHWRIPPSEFANTFNALQLLTPLAVAIGANSPTLFGHELWDETRIAVFKQSIDYRNHASAVWRHPSRISFGNGWVRHSAFEAFAETVALYPPLLPLIGKEDSLAVVANGKVPKLEELKLHHGTVWPWNRAVYDDSAGGHLRIEMRSLPAGPTAQDMTANVAFIVGAAQALKTRMPETLPSLPFSYANHNFYRAAQDGIDANIIWPSKNQTSLAELPVLKAVLETLPFAEQGLSELGVDEKEIKRTLGIIRKRVEAKTSGARWQRRMLTRVINSEGSERAFHGLLENYLRELSRGLDVSEWSDEI